MAIRRVRVLATAALACVTALSAAVVPAAADTRIPQPTGSSPALCRTFGTLAARHLDRDELIGQLFVQLVHGATADTKDSRNVAYYGVETPAEVVQKYKLGGVILFGYTGNMTEPKQVAGLTNGLQKAAIRSGAHLPLLISTDQETGVVTRLPAPATTLPGSMALAAGRDTDAARRAAEITGQELRAVGVNTNHAPDADVNVNPQNPVIGVRSFGSDPALVSQFVAAQVKGYQGAGRTVSTVKHFPGHGDTAVDSHTGLPVITHTREQWEQLDAPPFKAAVKADADMIMTAHLVVPALDPSGLPATLSKPIMTDLLRGELGYRGVVITDSLEMAGVRQQFDDGEVAVRALEAGSDLLLISPKIDDAIAGIKSALASGRLTEKQLQAKVARSLTLKCTRQVLTRPFVDTAKVDSQVGTKAHQAEAATITDRTATLLENADGVLPLQPNGRSILVTGYGDATTATLAEGLTKQGATATAQATGTRPTDAQIDQAVTSAKSSDTVVVLTNKAWDTKVTDPQARQQKLVAALQASGTDVVVVAVRDPYDITHLPGTRSYLATYSYSDVSIRSLARVLTGEIEPAGKLPVDIPAADGSIAYPLGSGLGY